ncbi:helix-turn-helix domain-containing protein [uncultured Anaerofustis sp.]|uniref:helix-turn-helix domain-containing protein n=1 Tax=uncultured Anaerofustis sp. TaxID=904996 RepID=UPI0025D5826F|nr:helix-turn-helix domain-containing protein [uncultured Anaerofustis sp.]
MGNFRRGKSENKSKCGFTVMNNHHLRDKELSLKAKGLLSLMLSLPPDWEYSVNGLCCIVKEGRDSVKNALDELKKHGYLEVFMLTPDKSGTGRIKYIYKTYELPKDREDEEDKKGFGKNDKKLFCGADKREKMDVTSKQEEAVFGKNDKKSFCVAEKKEKIESKLKQKREAGGIKVVSDDNEDKRGLYDKSYENIKVGRSGSAKENRSIACKDLKNKEENKNCLETNEYPIDSKELGGDMGNDKECKSSISDQGDDYFFNQNKKKQGTKNQYAVNEGADDEHSESKRQINNDEQSIDKINIDDIYTMFAKPDRESIKSYCMERKNSIDAGKFYDFYESKGWMIGSSPMRDWKACIRNWERNEEEKVKREKAISKNKGKTEIESDRYYDMYDDYSMEDIEKMMMDF